MSRIAQLMRGMMITGVALFAANAGASGTAYMDCSYALVNKRQEKAPYSRRIGVFVVGGEVHVWSRQIVQLRSMKRVDTASHPEGVDANGRIVISGLARYRRCADLAWVAIDASLFKGAKRGSIVFGAKTHGGCQVAPAVYQCKTFLPHK